MCGISGCSIAAMRWLIRPSGRIVFWRNGRCSFIIKFGKQFALWVALCVVIIATFPFGVHHHIPSSVERILHGPKPFLLLVQAPCYGQEFSA